MYAGSELSPAEISVQTEARLPGGGAASLVGPSPRSGFALDRSARRILASGVGLSESRFTPSPSVWAMLPAVQGPNASPQGSHRMPPRRYRRRRRSGCSSLELSCGLLLNCSLGSGRQGATIADRADRPPRPVRLLARSGRWRRRGPCPPGLCPAAVSEPPGRRDKVLTGCLSRSRPVSIGSPQVGSRPMLLQLGSVIDLALLGRGDTELRVQVLALRHSIA